MTLKLEQEVEAISDLKELVRLWLDLKEAFGQHSLKIADQQNVFAKLQHRIDEAFDRLTRS